MINIKWFITTDILLEREYEGAIVYDTNIKGQFCAIIATVYKLPEGVTFTPKTINVEYCQFQSEPFDLRDVSFDKINLFLEKVRNFDYDMVSITQIPKITKVKFS